MQQTSAKNCLLQPLRPRAGTTYCVGFSGGRDSVALLHALASLRAMHGFSLVALHMNHCLRGDESDADEQFCREFCAQLDVPLEVQRVDVHAFAAANRLSIEDAARRCRFEWFEKQAAALGASGIYLAHHADDQAETVLLRLFRGAGLRGLAGMKRTTTFRTLVIFRPWLGIRQQVIEDYRTAHELPCRHDSSNESTHFERNWARHVVLPEIAARFGDGVVERINQSADVCRAAEDHLQCEAKRLFDRHGCISVLGFGFPLRMFTRLNQAVRRAVLRHIFDMLHGWERQHIDYEAVEALLVFACTTTPVLPRPLPDPWLAFKAFGHLFITFISSSAFLPGSLKREGDTEVTRGMTVSIARLARRGRGVSDNGEAWREVALGRPATMVQYASLPARARLAIRPRAAGDRYQPVHGADKKVKKFMIEAGIPQKMKTMIPVVTANGRPVWLVGWRVADPFKVVKGRTVYRLTCRVDFTTI